MRKDTMKESSIKKLPYFHGIFIQQRNILTNYKNFKVYKLGRKR